MPSAANVKIEKSSSAVAVGSDNGIIDTNGSPLRQAITVVEHKIRNLEKRKSKLESYRDLQKSGKDLNADQKTAIAKYDEVVQTLEFARDLYKQFLGIAVVSEKDEKKKARKEAVARSQAELNKVREVLLIQDALSNMGQESIREDFLNSRNGAAQLTQADLKLLDDYYAVVTPKHEAGDPTAFMLQVQAAAEHLLAAVDGKNKEVFGSSYGNVKDVIGKIHESGYLDQVAIEETYEEAVAEVEVAAPVVEPTSEQSLPLMDAPLPQPPLPIVEQAPPQQAPPPPQMQQLEPVPPMQPSVVAEQAMFYQQAPPPPPPQQRPIAEVIGTGSFFFLQDSELDTPPEQIASQTFTNQSFVGAPPPPIPMPPHFAQFPNTPQPLPPAQAQPPQQPPLQQLTTQPVPPAVVASQMPLTQQHNAMPTVAPPSQITNKNGYGDHSAEQQQHDEVIRHRNSGHRHHSQRSNITSHHQPHQTYFANNNGYSNRPNRNRNNGPRLNRQNNQ